MKEQLYTIPLNDAVNAQDECPFCYIERSVEQDLLDFVLGSGSSYMEADIREMTDKAGFCRIHFQKMFDYGNTLGNAWILKTHYQRMIGEMQKEFAGFKPGKTSLKDKLRKTAESGNAIGMLIASALIGISSGQYVPVMISEATKGNEDRTSLITSGIFLLMGLARMVMPLGMGAVSSSSLAIAMILPAAAALLCALCSGLAEKCK